MPVAQMRKREPRGSRGHTHAPSTASPAPVSHRPPPSLPLSPSSLEPLTSGSVPSVFHTLMQTQTRMQSMEDRAMSQPMP